MQPEPGLINDGYISPLQKEQFQKQLSFYPDIRTIVEIGFNGGHSADHFFRCCASLQFLVAFDLNAYPCTAPAVEYLSSLYGDRFVFIEGDSLQKVPEVSQKFPYLRFDLIYIDGCHDFEWTLSDIMNTKKMAHQKTLLWIDDVDPDFHNPVGAAVRFAENLGWIKIESHFNSEDVRFGKRNWVQARF